MVGAVFYIVRPVIRVLGTIGPRMRELFISSKGNVGFGTCCQGASSGGFETVDSTPMLIVKF